MGEEDAEAEGGRDNGSSHEHENGMKVKKPTAASIKSSWTFSYEALTGVQLLRLFLFNNNSSGSGSGSDRSGDIREFDNVVDTSCRPSGFLSLRAYLLRISLSSSSSSPVVVCRWKGASGVGGGNYAVYVPMPLCPIDHSVPFAVFGRDDHIEIKMRLLPLTESFLLNSLRPGSGSIEEDEPSQKAEGGVGDAEAKSDLQRTGNSSVSLHSDAEVLNGMDGASFHCRNCSAKLTTGVISLFQALPSAHWRELADHWFGGCCSRKDDQTRSRMARFEQQLTLRKGVCLVGSTTCITHYDDLVCSAGDHDHHHRHDNSVNGTLHTAKVSAVACEEKPMMRRDDDDDDEGATGKPSNGTLVSSSHTLSEKEEEEAAANLRGQRAPAIERNLSGGDSLEESESFAGCALSCGGHERGTSTATPSGPLLWPKTPVSGFMNGSSTFSTSRTWTPFNCYACGSLIGVSSGDKEEGVQLFKCHISSDANSGGHPDVFRHHTLERVFSNELLSTAEDDSQNRYIIRDLNSRVPLLHVVVMNQESWMCSGPCLGECRVSSSYGENGQGMNSDHNGHHDDADRTSDRLFESVKRRQQGKFPPVFLGPAVKVMFRDARCFTSEQFSDVEVWARNQGADEIYMLSSTVESLTDSLQANTKFFPGCCQGYQDFLWSFLAR